ncbi:hypothetical protein LTS18_013005 [Coniosporium uncinatum]|uniref:Uncharacterized protein n=1 Tax=Coniosporium uncinatum TaxID=93489 RepID=A0ACC3DVU2_9PEZI|nr:hypothetical protein LTS18_013005 [Coniosporium uncinatum]
MNAYAILGLPGPPQNKATTADEIKRAYRRALLTHHPDKATTPTKLPKPTIDEITIAFQTLSTPSLRGELDRQLLLSAKQPPTQKEAFTISHATEIIDLDDLSYDEAQGRWYRGCRCGMERGFILEEDQLEEHAELGEIVVGCRGCSLWVKVLFGVADEQADTDAVDGGKG